VDDNSNDGTADIARTVVPASNVISVERSGKGLAITKAAKEFRLAEYYRWVHLADADGGFSSDYFEVLSRELNPNNAAATGYIKSMPGGIVSQYRAFEYTFGMDVARRFQDLAGTIPIIPGPTSCFRSDVFDKLQFANGMLAEDFDVTLQIHRNKLGKIQFIEDAIVYTQDPATIKDFKRQITRWNRGIMQGIVRHKIGRKLSKLDAYLMYQIALSMGMIMNYFVILPIIAAQKGVVTTLATIFLIDVCLFWTFVSYAAMRSRRWDMLNAFPHIYLLRWISLWVFMRSFVEVIILRKFAGNGIWNTVTRREVTA
jgi:cellulose synthase/poly-beta-1,6-N-acetylglucosamine synthase-like glycosyltransferase